MMLEGLNGRIVSITQFDKDFLTLIGAANAAFSAVYSMFVKSICDSSVDPSATREKLTRRVAGKSEKYVNSVFIGIDFETSPADKIKFDYVVDKNGDIQFDMGQRGMKEAPSIMGGYFKNLVDDRNKIAHSIVRDSDDGIILWYDLKDGGDGQITTDFLNHFIEDCDFLSNYIALYKQAENEVSREAVQ